MDTIELDDVAAAALELLYLAVGLAVLAVQRIGPRRREVADLVAAGTANPRQLLEDQLVAVDARLGPVLEEVASYLPDPARDAVSQVRRAVRRPGVDVPRDAPGGDGGPGGPEGAQAASPKP